MKKVNGFRKGLTNCGREALIHVGATGKPHRGCPRNSTVKKPCRWA